MSFIDRQYDQIVRDMLTTLTGGTVRETLTVPVSDLPLELPKLRERPVRRVSNLEGFIEVGTGDETRQIPYRFTPADFELISSSGNENEKDSIVFRKDGRRPAPSSVLTVNYYPVQAGPAPLTDLNVGSVTRTLVETVAREMAMLYLQMQAVYDSAFIDTATGPSLDKVVALIGVTRLPAGNPLVQVRFSRRPGDTGRITVPSGTAVTDASGNRYLTLETLTLEPYETTREVQAGGEAANTALVPANALDRLETLVAGISTVSNPQPASRLTAPESDEALRRRVRSALQVAVRGTVDSLRFGLLSIPGVKDVGVYESPNGVPGEVRLEIAYTQDTPEVRKAVSQRIDELRPAGVRVIQSDAQKKKVSVQVELVLAGPGVIGSELNALTAAVEERLFSYLSSISPGGQVRRSRLNALVLEDNRIADARVSLTPQNGTPVEELSLAAGEVLDVIRPFNFPAPTSEQAAGAQPAALGSVHAMLPIHLAAGVTLVDATQAIQLALDGYVTSRRPEAPLTVDGLAAAIRDDSRFALVRNQTVVTVESGGRFVQLTDGVGTYTPATNESLAKGEVSINLLEGGV